jgi:hypothetical protein
MEDAFKEPENIIEEIREFINNLAHKVGLNGI